MNALDVIVRGCMLCCSRRGRFYHAFSPNPKSLGWIGSCGVAEDGCTGGLRSTHLLHTHSCQLRPRKSPFNQDE